MTTGAGVHSGDAGIGMEGRLEVDIDLMAHIHGYTMYAYLFLTLIVVVGLFRTKAPQHTRNLGLLLVLFILIQAGVGILQYNMGVPRWTVPLHVIGSAILTAATGLLWSMRFRRGEDTLDRDFDNWDAGSDTPHQVVEDAQDAAR